MRLAFLSDIHAGRSDEEAVSYAVNSTARPCPFDALVSALDGRTADYLLVGGDITDKADAEAFGYAFAKLKTLAAELSAKLICTVGNHDLDSRTLDWTFDPRDPLLRYADDFPVLGDPQASDRYWARNFVLLQYPDLLLLVINSCAAHGYRNQDSGDEEFNIGRVSAETVVQIDRELAALPAEAADLPAVMLVHHHPVAFEREDRVQRYQRSVGRARPRTNFVNAGLLLKKLAKRSNGWVVLHGHQHIPRLRRAPTEDAPVYVLSAASFSRHAEIHWNEGCGNQFYMIDIKAPREALEDGLDPIAGSIETWTLVPPSDFADSEAKWRLASDRDGLPSLCGFGTSSSPASIADRLQRAMGRNSLQGDELAALLHDWDYLLPGQRVSVVEDLHRRSVTTNFGDQFERAKSERPRAIEAAP